ncbi:hypothetical protein Cylst_2071 [Cylindrospermum stagnale PCC 7417]|uniref:Uncharacterized protein n=1 Tax=Cylindrospermum stagnale PCC 7417 TaxID=56107 RepID=K9WVS3_9NOST|nr:hypothetical protein [Cylindrospermum stagnale]AFZ24313.1 hypothetical protein Cylst_2071 [Cylindrospermum stagnale PCC 7417]
MTINTQLTTLAKNIEETYSASVLAADYFRYDIHQTKVKLTISEPREVDVFEEFVLQCAIDINNPSTSVE